MKEAILILFGLFYSWSLMASSQAVRYVSANEKLKAIGIEKGLLTVDIHNQKLMLNQKKVKINSFQKAIIQIIAESVKKAEICKTKNASQKIILHKNVSPKASNSKTGFCNENVSNLISDNFKVLKNSIGSSQLR
ncbi:MAG: hypothetical protein VX642_14000 [Bdellovibrionota bacterium]|nr:hypothetical protein [Bdellovibrionota bacterium]